MLKSQLNYTFAHDDDQPKSQLLFNPSNSAGDNIHDLSEANMHSPFDSIIPALACKGIAVLQTLNCIAQHHTLLLCKHIGNSLQRRLVVSSKTTMFPQLSAQHKCSCDAPTFVLIQHSHCFPGAAIVVQVQPHMQMQHNYWFSGTVVGCNSRQAGFPA